MSRYSPKVLPPPPRGTVTVRRFRLEVGAGAGQIGVALDECASRALKALRARLGGSDVGVIRALLVEAHGEKEGTLLQLSRDRRTSKARVVRDLLIEAYRKAFGVMPPGQRTLDLPRWADAHARAYKSAYSVAYRKLPRETPADLAAARSAGRRVGRKAASALLRKG